MLWLYILLAIFLIIVLILLLPIRVYASYYKELKLNIYIGFVKLQLYPEKVKNKKITKKSKKAVEKKPEPKTEKQSFFKDKEITEIIDLIKKISNLATGVLKDFFRHIIVKKLMLSISVAGYDAADTAIKYGECCAGVYPAVALITKSVNCKEYGVDISPDFTERADSQLSFELDAKILLLWVVALVLKHGFKGIKLLLEIKGE